MPLLLTVGRASASHDGQADVPNLIGAHGARTGRTVPVSIPHDHATHIGQVHYASPADVTAAIDAALAASRWWSRLPWEERVAPFLRAGTNDKAGTVWNLIRFASPRAVKRNHLAVHDYRYPHMEP